MGGNLFKRGRLPRAKYLEIEQEIRAYLDQRFGRDLYRIPRYYGSKADFGDVDILLSKNVIDNNESSSNWAKLQSEIVQSLNIKEFKLEGRVFSTLYRDFQVDFFLVSHDEMNSQSSFMDFNDLGNIIGRLFRPFNLKYGQEGLYYLFRRATGGYRKEIFVSRDWERILTFVQLDYVQWVNGFDQIEEMFEWVVQSPYFRSSPYRDPTSPILRSRAKQRPTIQKFLQYLEERNIERSFPSDEPKESFIPLIEAHFPGIALAEAVALEHRKEDEANQICAKFNGKLLMEWYPSLEGKALGQFMTKFMEDIPHERLLEMTADDVESEVRKRRTMDPSSVRET